MGDISEALKKAERERRVRLAVRVERGEPGPAAEPPAGRGPGPEPSGREGEEQQAEVYFDRDSPLAERYRSFWRNLRSSTASKPLRTLTITSCDYGERKSLCAANLAFSMVEEPARSVLLVDADLKRRETSRLFGLQSDRGLAEFLAGEAPLESVLFKTDGPDVYIVPAGQPAVSPSQLLESKRLETLTSSLKERFDWTVIDGPPVIPAADSERVASLAGGVVLVVRAGKTRREVIREAESRLKEAHANLLGFLLADVEYVIPEFIYKRI